MATHSSVLAWRIPGTGEPGGLPSMGSHRVDSSNFVLNVHLLFCLLIHFLLNAHATLHVLVKKDKAQVLHFFITLTFKYYLYLTIQFSVKKISSPFFTLFVC